MKKIKQILFSILFIFLWFFVSHIIGNDFGIYIGLGTIFGAIVFNNL